jgi:hypothetical protein
MRVCKYDVVTRIQPAQARRNRTHGIGRIRYAIRPYARQFTRPTLAVTTHNKTLPPPLDCITRVSAELLLRQKCSNSRPEPLRSRLGPTYDAYFLNSRVIFVGRNMEMMLKRMIVCVATQLSGCVGFGVFYKAPEEIKIDTVKISNGLRGEIYDYGVTPTSYTKADIRQVWGEPDAITLTGGTEKWLYKGKLSWGGVMVIAIVVPVPILVPVGRDSTELIFTGELLTGVVTDREKRFSFFCGPVMNGGKECGFSSK